MNLPFFHTDHLPDANKNITLDEDTSKHTIQVLRMQRGERLQLTDGKGNLYTASVWEDNRKKCVVEILEREAVERHPRQVTIGISLLKNNSRFEWFLEKATELGVACIIPLICARTEKQQFKTDRARAILLSAMLQSRQCWLPELHEPVKMDKLDLGGFSQEQKFIAHCMEGERSPISELLKERVPSKIMLIGPEGDFTPDEAASAIKHHFIPVSLGHTRLRTETAGVVAATLLCLV